jgi:hypothetical protein
MQKQNAKTKSKSAILENGDPGVGRKTARHCWWLSVGEFSHAFESLSQRDSFRRGGLGTTDFRRPEGWPKGKNEVKGANLEIGGPRAGKKSRGPS